MTGSVTIVKELKAEFGGYSGVKIDGGFVAVEPAEVVDVVF